ncbi:hypothetical protein OFM15_28135, partial [Escherichia coli]|nr:hypothetical protein [Escherichia coli]
MLEAILFFLTGCSVGSSKPNEKLDPPPEGRKTRELFLLLGSTPLKVVVVVMAQRGEVDWPPCHLLTWPKRGGVVQGSQG